MLKLLRDIIAIPYKLRHFDEILEETEKLKLEQEKILQTLELEKLEKEKIIRSESRIAQNLTIALQQKQELARRLIQAKSSFQGDTSLDTPHQDSSGNDLKTIEQILVEFNCTDNSR